MSWHIGIDPASVNVGLAAIREDGELRHQSLHATGEFEDRYVWLRGEVRRWLTPFADDGIWNVVIERPVTRGHGSTGSGAVLLGAFGVIVEATRSMLPNTIVQTLTDAQWKSHALTGRAKKADIFVGARLLGYDGSSQDVADAICIADAARVLAAGHVRGEAA